MKATKKQMDSYWRTIGKIVWWKRAATVIEGCYTPLVMDRIDGYSINELYENDEYIAKRADKVGSDDWFAVSEQLWAIFNGMA